MCRICTPTTYVGNELHNVPDDERTRLDRANDRRDKPVGPDYPNIWETPGMMFYGRNPYNGELRTQNYTHPMFAANALKRGEYRVILQPITL